MFKEDSTTRKLRVVFVGSAKTTNTMSINDAMMVGPVVQDDLYSIIMRFILSSFLLIHQKCTLLTSEESTIDQVSTTSHRTEKKHFGSEYIELKNNQVIGKNTKLRNLSPFIDEEFDVIRVGGSLALTNYHEDKKFPTLISKHSKLVPLIIRKFHEATLLTLNY